MDTRRVPPPTQSTWGQPTRSPYNSRYKSGDRVTTGSAELDRKLGIAGVQKGAAGPLPSWSATPARASKPAAAFRVGDAVYHRVFGKGTVAALTGQGAEQRVKIRFVNGSERTFSAAAAPIVKVEK